jgi:hypothetical protein
MNDGRSPLAHKHSHSIVLILVCWLLFLLIVITYHCKMTVSNFYEIQHIFTLLLLRAYLY